MNLKNWNKSILWLIVVIFQGLNGRCFKGTWVGQYKDYFGCSMADCCLTDIWFGLMTVVCRLSIHSEISIRFRDNEAVWNKLRRSNRGILMFDVTIHDHFIHHIDNEKIIGVLYRDHDSAK